MKIDIEIEIEQAILGMTLLSAHKQRLLRDEQDKFKKKQVKKEVDLIIKEIKQLRQKDVNILKKYKEIYKKEVEKL